MNRKQKMKALEGGGVVVMVVLVGLGLTLTARGAHHLIQQLPPCGATCSAKSKLAADSPSSGVATPDMTPGASGQLAFDNVTSLKLEIANGDVTIKPSADARASLDWTVKAGNGANAAAADTLQVSAELSGGKLVIHDDYSGGKHLQRPGVSLTVNLPASAVIDAALGNGDLRIDSNAKLAASLGNGTLTLAGHCPAAEASVGNGTLKTDWLIGGGEYDLSVGNGSIELGVEDGSSYKFDATTGMGAIDLNGMPGQLSKTLTSQSANGTLGAGEGNLSLSVGLGDIRFNGAGARAQGASTAPLGA
jgi:hypothetical protein